MLNNASFLWALLAPLRRRISRHRRISYLLMIFYFNEFIWGPFYLPVALQGLLYWNVFDFFLLVKILKWNILYFNLSRICNKGILIAWNFTWRTLVWLNSNRASTVSLKIISHNNLFNNLRWLWTVNVIDCVLINRLLV